MSWNEIAITHPNVGKVRPDVFMSASCAGGRRRQAVSISVRASNLDGLDWFVHGGRVKLKIGAGEHMGMLRIEPDGPCKLICLGARSRASLGGAITLQNSELPRLLRLPPVAQKSTPVEFEWGERWIEITLPAWARVPGDVPAAAPPPATQRPFKGLMRDGAGPVLGVPSAPVRLTGERRP